MKILYTGAASPDTPQNQAIRSLGGFLSSSPIPNGEIGSLFSGVSGILKPGYRSIRMIGIKNDEISAKSNLKIWGTINDPNLTITLAAMAPAFDSGCNRYYFERIESPSSLPLQAQFTEYTELSPLEIGSLESNTFIGLWIKIEKSLVTTTTTTDPLTTTTTTIPPGYCSCRDQEILDLRAKDINPIQLVDIGISISFD